MNAWTIYPSIQNHNHYAIGSPDGRELRQGEAVEILLGGFRIPGLVEYSSNGDYFTAMTGQSICGLYAGMKLYLAAPTVTVPCGAGARSWSSCERTSTQAQRTRPERRGAQWKARKTV